MGKACSRLCNQIEKKVVSSKMPTIDANRQTLSVAPDSPAAAQFDHSLWDRVLRDQVSRGTVDGIELNVLNYRGVAQDPRFEQYVTALAEAEVERLHPNEQLALYINAYNALCVGLIVRWCQQHNGQLPKSINDLSEGNQQVWDLPAGTVAGSPCTLNDIEHTILRQRWKEPRVHASIVCASASCPDLRNEAFVAAHINRQMDEQCVSWLNNAKKGVGLEGNTLTASRILMWFSSDFEHGNNSSVDWAMQYLSDQHPAKGRTTKNPLFLSYSWELNNGSKAQIRAPVISKI